MLSHLSRKTTTRQDFIAFFAEVAECFPPSVFHDRNHVPVIFIKGGTSLGKSLAAETMMKTWSDDHDLQDSLETEKKHMFLEGYEAEATDRTLSRNFNIRGRKTAMYFNSDGIYHSPEVKAKEEIHASRVIEGGAVFVSNIGVFDKDHSQGQWLSIAVEHSLKKISSPADLWKRSLKITACHGRLLEDPYFQSRWQELRRNPL